MHDEPKSILRYVAAAALLVAPLLYFVSTHIDTKVAPVSGYVAQTYGVAVKESRLAQTHKAAAVR